MDSFVFNCSVVNQHIGSIPIMKQSHITQTHALCVVSLVLVLVIKSILLLNGPFLSIELQRECIFSLSFFMSWFVYIHTLRRKSFLVKAILKHFQSLHENHYELR